LQIAACLFAKTLTNKGLTRALNMLNKYSVLIDKATRTNKIFVAR
jgi:hypothetical protein